jgi:hypothetical protein
MPWAAWRWLNFLAIFFASVAAAATERWESYIPGSTRTAPMVRAETGWKTRSLSVLGVDAPLLPILGPIERRQSSGEAAKQSRDPFFPVWVGPQHDEIITPDVSDELIGMVGVPPQELRHHPDHFVPFDKPVHVVVSLEVTDIHVADDERQ